MNNNINIDNNLINLKDILDNKKVIVPIIQRGYAQGRTDAEATDIRDNFLDYIIKYLFNENYNNDFILDIVYGVNDDNIFYPIDGQQRLTTLFLFHWYIYNHLKADRTFLSNFSYETRITSTDFLSLLNSDKINIDFDKDIISNQIISNISFLNYYRKDPTVKGILLVLDEIHKKIKSCIKAVNNKEDILKRLDNIKFFKLDIKGDYDDLYIKMNSRGKQLTDFEIFKSKLEKFLDENKDKNVQVFDKKIDIDWTNFIWDFIKDKKNGDENNKGNEGNELDDLFMKLFHFIFEMLYYSQIEIVEDTSKLEIEKSNLDFFELFFSHKGDKEKKEYVNKLKAIENNEEDKKIALKNNIEFIINIFDILSELRKDEDKLKNLFNYIFYHNNELKNDEDKYNKICTFDDNLNVFNNDDNLFEFANNIRKRILIFSVLKILNYEYLKNEKDIKNNIDNIKKTYLNKLRLIRNLLYNTNNLQNNNIYYQMKLIDRIIKEDEITVMEDQLSGQEKRIKNILFTDKLVESEKNKLTILENTDENTRKRIYACENNVFLQGNIDFLLDNIDNENIVNVVNYIFTKNGFNNENGNYLIHRAILVFIDKNEIENFKPYRSTTISIFRNNKDKDNDNKKLLIKYPNKLKEFINTIFNDKVNETISGKCRNIINNYKDDSHWKYLLIKNAKDANDNDVNLYNREYSYSGEVKKHPYSGYYLYYQYRNSTHWDIPLSTKVHTMFSQFLKNNADFKLYYYDGTNNPNIKGERILRYPNQNNDEILYCYSWVTLAKEIEIANEKVLVGFTTAGYIIQCGLRKQKSFNDPEISKKVFEELIKYKQLNFYGYKQHYEHPDWYYMKDLDNYDEMLKEYNKILKPVIDTFLKNK